MPFLFAPLALLLPAARAELLRELARRLVDAVIANLTDPLAPAYLGLDDLIALDTSLREAEWALRLAIRVDAHGRARAVFIEPRQPKLPELGYVPSPAMLAARTMRCLRLWCDHARLAQAMAERLGARLCRGGERRPLAAGLADRGCARPAPSPQARPPPPQAGSPIIN